MGQVIKEKISDELFLGVWEIEEDEAFFLDKMTLFPEEKNHLRRLKVDKKRLEWLAARWMLHLLSDRKERGYCYKDKYGKPHLENSAFHISISHSQNKAAILASKYPCGIDIQHPVEKIYRIAPKFISEAEYSLIKEREEMLAYHFIWGAKESIYKAHGKKGLDYKKNILIKCLPPTEDLKGELIINNQSTNFDLFYHEIDDEHLVYCVETQSL